MCLLYFGLIEGFKVKKVVEIVIEVIQLSIEFIIEVIIDNNFENLKV